MAVTHLHLHTEYSLLDGACRINQLVDRVKALGQAAVAITDHERVVAYVGEYEEDFPPGSLISTQATRDVLASGRMQTFSLVRRIDEDAMANLDAGSRLRLMGFMPAGIVVPLSVRDQTIGTLKFYYRDYKDIDHTQYAVAEGFGELLGTQLSFYELERQAQLTAQAEVKALQAQIQPLPPVTYSIAAGWQGNTVNYLPPVTLRTGVHPITLCAPDQLS